MSTQDKLPELDADALALLADFAQEERPPSAARARVKARVLETIIAAPAPAPVPAPTATVLRGPWVPWIAGGALAAAAAALLVLGMRGGNVTAARDPSLQQAPDTPEFADSLAVEQEQRPASSVRTRPDDTTPPPASSTPEQTSALIDPGTPPLPESAAIVPRTPHHPTPTHPRPPEPTAEPTPAPAQASSSSSLAQETRLLERARAAVTGNRPQAALTLLREAEERFPNGVLRQERAVLRVVALCDAGKVSDGRTAAAAFLRAHPQSALRSRVESACPETTP